MNVRFSNRVKKVDLDFNSSKFTTEDIQNETMLHGASWNYAAEQGGPITQAVLKALANTVDFTSATGTMSLNGYHPIIDTKSVMLMAGQYPCIPGWHCDGVIRPSTGAQPDIQSLIDQPNIVHYAVEISRPKNVCKLTFATNLVHLEVDGLQVWKGVHNQIAAKSSIIGATSFETGSVMKFYRDSLHTGVPAEKSCWRYFFRLSFYHMPARNLIRKQVQVYSSVDGGW